MALLFATTRECSHQQHRSNLIVTEQLSTMSLVRGDAQMKEAMIIALVTIEPSMLGPPISPCN